MQSFKTSEELVNSHYMLVEVFNSLKSNLSYLVFPFYAFCFSIAIKSSSSHKFKLRENQELSRNCLKCLKSFTRHKKDEPHAMLDESGKSLKNIDS